MHAFSADELSSEQVKALKRLEQKNRDLGAIGIQTSDWAAERGRFQLEAEARTYVRYLQPGRTDRVLDAGAGVGRLALVIAPLVSELLAVDCSSSALQVLRNAAAVRGLSSICTLQGDLCDLPDSVGTFDAAYSIEVIQHIPSKHERLRAVRNLRAVLKPGGRCLISVSAWNWRTRRAGSENEGFWGSGDRRLYAYCFSPAQLGEIMLEAGFSSPRIRGLIVLPGRIARLLPPNVSFLETWFSALPPVAYCSWYVFAVARR